jgi:hypothetical protein
VSALDATSCQFAAQFKGAILTLAKALPLEGRRSFGSSPNSVDRWPFKLSFVGPFFVEMNHSDAVLAIVFLLASVIWLIRLSVHSFFRKDHTVPLRCKLPKSWHPGFRLAPTISADSAR